MAIGPSGKRSPDTICVNAGVTVAMVSVRPSGRPAAMLDLRFDVRGAASTATSRDKPGPTCVRAQSAATNIASRSSRAGPGGPGYRDFASLCGSCGRGCRAIRSWTGCQIRDRPHRGRFRRRDQGVALPNAAAGLRHTACRCGRVAACGVRSAARKNSGHRLPDPARSVAGAPAFQAPAATSRGAWIPDENATERGQSRHPARSAACAGVCARVFSFSATQDVTRHDH